MGDGGQARHIQLDHRQRRVQRGIQERGLQPVAGVVNQNVDRNASLTEPLVQLDDCCYIRKIYLLHNDINAGLLA